MRTGLYAVYHGRQFKAAKTMSGRVKLVAENDPPRGFKKTRYGNFVKKVDADKVEKLFLVKSFAEVDGKRFQIESEENGYYTISKGGNGKAEDYRESISASMVDRVVEEETEITRYF